LFAVEKDTSSYAYFYLSSDQQKSLKKLSFTIYLPFEFDNDPELLFFASKDISLN